MHVPRPPLSRYACTIGHPRWSGSLSHLSPTWHRLLSLTRQKVECLPPGIHHLGKEINSCHTCISVLAPYTHTHYSLKMLVVLISLWLPWKLDSSLVPQRILTGENLHTNTYTKDYNKHNTSKDKDLQVNQSEGLIQSLERKFFPLIVLHHVCWLVRMLISQSEYCITYHFSSTPTWSVINM